MAMAGPMTKNNCRHACTEIVDVEHHTEEDYLNTIWGLEHLALWHVHGIESGVV